MKRRERTMTARRHLRDIREIEFFAAQLNLDPRHLTRDFKCRMRSLGRPAA